MNRNSGTHKKTQYIVKLKRLIPGACTAINAVIDEGGHIMTDTGDMAKLLVEHWAQVFQHTPVMLEHLTEWHNSLPQPPSRAPEVLGVIATGVTPPSGDEEAEAQSDSQRQNDSHDHRQNGVENANLFIFQPSSITPLKKV